MSPSDSALLIAVSSAGLSLASAVFVEVSRRRSAREMAALQIEQSRTSAELADSLVRKRESESKSAEARRLVARYRDPLLISSFDLQSRIFNVLRPGGFRGSRQPDYFRSNTLFVIAEFFGWLEIIRRDLQFLDLGAAEDTRLLLDRIESVRHVFASTSGWRDEYYIYRGEQRAIGELMAVDSTTIGYASFVAKLEEPAFARWFDRLGKAIDALPGQRPERFVHLQNALIDLIDFLDPGEERLTTRRERLT